MSTILVLRKLPKQDKLFETNHNCIYDGVYTEENDPVSKEMTEKLYVNYKDYPFIAKRSRYQWQFHPHFTKHTLLL